MWDLIVSVPDHCLSFYFRKNHSQRWEEDEHISFNRSPLNRLILMVVGVTQITLQQYFLLISVFLLRTFLFTKQGLHVKCLALFDSISSQALRSAARIKLLQA